MHTRQSYGQGGGENIRRLIIISSRAGPVVLDLDRTGRNTGPQVPVDRVRSGYGRLSMCFDHLPSPTHQGLHRHFRIRIEQIHTGHPRGCVLVFVHHRMGFSRHAGLHGNHLLRRECSLLRVQS